MKYSHICLSFASVAALAFAGCQKETLTTAASTDSDFVVGQAKAAGLQWLRDDSGGGNHQCPPNGNKCTRETFLTPSDAGVVGTVFTTVVGGNQTQIIAAFTTHKATLNKYISTQLVDAVINGQIIPTGLTNASSGVRFMIFGTAPNEQVYEFPKA